MNNLNKFLDEMNYRHDNDGNPDQGMTNVDEIIAQIASRVVRDPQVLADIALFGSLSDNIHCEAILRSELAHMEEKNHELRGLAR